MVDSNDDGSTHRAVRNDVLCHILRVQTNIVLGFVTDRNTQSTKCCRLGNLLRR